MIRSAIDIAVRDINKRRISIFTKQIKMYWQKMNIGYRLASAECYYQAVFLLLCFQTV